MLAGAQSLVLANEKTWRGNKPNLDTWGQGELCQVTQNLQRVEGTQHSKQRDRGKASPNTRVVKGPIGCVLGSFTAPLFFWAPGTLPGEQGQKSSAEK